MLRARFAPKESTILGEIVILLSLVVFNGVLAGSEIALVSIRKTRIDQMIQEKRGGAIAVKRLRSDPERFLATVQIGVTVIGATAGAFSGSSLAKALEPFIRTVPYLQQSAEQVSLAIVISLISFLTLVLGELVPKSLALRSAETYGLVVSRPLLLISTVFRPVVWFLTASSNVVLRLFGDKTTFTDATLRRGAVDHRHPGHHQLARHLRDRPPGGHRGGHLGRHAADDDHAAGGAPADPR